MKSLAFSRSMTTSELSIHLIAFKMCVTACLSVYLFACFVLFDFRFFFYLKQTSFILSSVLIKQTILIKDSDQKEAAQRQPIHHNGKFYS